MSDSTALSTVKSATSVKPFIPDSYGDVWEMSSLLYHSGMAPQSLNSREKIAVAIFYGKELGLTPMAALQCIAVVNGKTSIWGDGALAICSQHPAFKDIEEKIEGEGDRMVATCTIWRKDRERPTVRSFSVADAATAGLLTKDIWKKYLRRMLQMRARSWAMRDALPEALAGISIYEEARDIDNDGFEPRADAPTARPTPAPTAPEPPAEDAEFEELPAAPQPESEAKPAPKPEPRPAAQPKVETDPAKMAFSAYLPWLEAEMRKGDAVAAAETWMTRRRDFSKEERMQMVDMRNRVKADFEEAALKEAAAAVPASSEPDGEFDRVAFREAMLIAINEARTTQELIAIKTKIEELVEAETISQNDYESWFDDAMVTAFERAD